MLYLSTTPLRIFIYAENIVYYIKNVNLQPFRALHVINGPSVAVKIAMHCLVNKLTLQ